jgi:predicted amidohydrolase YtcJ
MPSADRAVRLALDGFEHARRANGARDNRHTIAHIELAHPDDFGRFAKLGVMANMQLQWAERDSYTIDAVRPYLGRRRWRRLYPAGSLHRAGARLCGGSDWPVDPLLPFRQIEMAVNRTGDEVYDAYPGVLNESQGLSLRASIAKHTRNSAFQLGQEARSGRDPRRSAGGPARARPQHSQGAAQKGLEDQGPHDHGGRQDPKAVKPARLLAPVEQVPEAANRVDA